jgi:hypothetical protein
MPPKQGQPPPPPPVGDKEEECVSNKEVHTMKNQQSTNTTLKQVEHSITGIIDWVDALETRLPLTD